jgi:hypothetical protein
MDPNNRLYLGVTNIERAACDPLFLDEPQRRVERGLKSLLGPKVLVKSLQRSAVRRLKRDHNRT